MTEAELLAQLRDVHLPEEPGWWPPAFGWWLLAFTLIALLLAGLFLLRRWRADAWRRAALHEHRQLNSGELTVDKVRELSVLMRRVALRVEPRHNVASATDQQWLETLDRLGNTRDYSEGVGRYLAVWPYQDLTTVPAEQLKGLFELTGHTINCANPQTRHTGNNKPGHTRSAGNADGIDSTGHQFSTRPQRGEHRV